ncbi:B3 domain-containing protein Os11g0197600-like isoform X2 [Asparagus officinalis]|uniref:B3 domain-containing protein Os11g0197600-like isoform X2 n=1 Tax=Asparagus officinalis TaxID=4686 RepID=UPI00098E4CB9|nr:B3 domain-containing protein Os11g0197600-like isoform X2 [Asparagus officinalis]
MAKSTPRYFFKVFFPDQSSNYLRIPSAFRERIEVESSKIVYLKGQSGGIWKVGLVKDCDGFVFEDGWKEFVADQSLAVGDFLVFRYNGNSRFKVLVFDSTACEKKKAFLARPSIEEDTEFFEDSEESKETEEDEEEEDNKPLIHFTNRRLNGFLKRSRGSNNLFDVNGSYKKRKQLQSEVDQSNSKRSKSSSICGEAHLSLDSGAEATPKDHPTLECKDLVIPKQEYESYSPLLSSSFSRDTPIHRNGESIHKTAAFSLRCSKINKQVKLCCQSGQVSRCSPQSTKGSTSRKSSGTLALVKSEESACRQRSIFRIGAFISQRRPVTEEEVERTLQRALSFTSEYPFVITIMQDSYVYTSFLMCIPSWFVREHLPKENTVLTVWDPSGKPWKMTFICNNTHGALSGGWSRFSHAHNLEKYDVCVFELTKPTHLKVHIYRVVEEITPLVRRRRGNCS